MKRVNMDTARSRRMSNNCLIVNPLSEEMSPSALRLRGGGRAHVNGRRRWEDSGWRSSA